MALGASYACATSVVYALMCSSAGPAAHAMATSAIHSKPMAATGVTRARRLRGASDASSTGRTIAASVIAHARIHDAVEHVGQQVAENHEHGSENRHAQERRRISVWCGLPEQLSHARVCKNLL